MDEPLDAPADMLLVGASGLVRLSGGEEGQEAHGCCGGIGLDFARAGAGLVARHAVQIVVLQAPMAVRILMVCQPDQAAGRRSFGVFGAAAGGQHSLTTATAGTAAVVGVALDSISAFIDRRRIPCRKIGDAPVVKTKVLCN